MNAQSRLRIIVQGYIIRGPLGGLVWHHLQYMLGLRAMGHEVVFFEDSDDYPSCYDPSRHVVDTIPTYGIQFANEVLGRFGLEKQWAYYDAHTDAWLGPLGETATDLCRHADMLLNLSGVNPPRAWTNDIPIRVLVDTDPVFTQVRHLRDPEARARAAQHTSFFTFAENVLSPDCEVPADGFSWLPTRQPLAPEVWGVSAPSQQGSFTTVMQWESYAPVEFDDCLYELKSRSFEPYWNLPSRTKCTLELALGGDKAPREELARSGWTITDPLEITRSAWSYQQYIQQSLGEFSVAKHGYVVSRSGWFSERSVAYLASGRPVVTQDTGFSRWLPTGLGLMCFSCLDEAASALEEVRGRYQQHWRAARDIAIEYFEYSTVLGKFLEEATNSPAGRLQKSRLDNIPPNEITQS